MEVFHLGQDWLTTSKVISIAEGRLKPVLKQEVISKIQNSYQTVQSISFLDKPVYGINTGFGPLCTTKISLESLIQLQENLLKSHAVGVGEFLDSFLVKIMLIAKAHALSLGFSGVRSLVVEKILWLLENEIIPLVPSKGSVGASGDLAPLSHCFLPLIGLGEVIYNGKIIPASQIVMNPIQLQAKEGLALINGTQFILAHAVTLVHQGYQILSASDLTGALTVEALSGSATPFSKELHAVRPFKGNIHVANKLFSWINGSSINQSHEDCDRVQDPYSLRCIPQVHGTARDIWLHLKERTEIELNSVTDNPLVFENEILSGGGFHGQPLALTLDYAALAFSEIGSIAERRIYLTLEGNAHGIPKLLISNPGINSGFMIVQYTAAALASENKSLCFPASADSIPTSLGQEDHVSMGSISGVKALKILDNVWSILGIELLTSSQALDFKLPLKPHPFLHHIHQEVRKNIPFVETDVLIGSLVNDSIAFIKSIDLNQIQNIYEQNHSPYHQLFEVY
ncbi:MAG: histidine ammonia-lyase [Bacteroidota bacterium]